MMDQSTKMVTLMMVMVTGGLCHGYAYNDYGYSDLAYDVYEEPYDTVDEYDMASDPPRFTSEPQAVVVTAGGEATFQCDVENLGQNVVIFQRLKRSGSEQLIFAGDVQVSMVRLFYKNGSTYTLSGARRSHAGEYTCKIESSPPLTLQHSLDVQYAPTVRLLSPDEQEAEEGATVIMECSADGNPAPEVTWSKATGPLPQGATQEGGVLTIEGVEVDTGEGEYVCTAENGVDRPTTTITTASTTLHVLHPPQATSRMHIEGSDEEGYKAILECEAIGYPLPTVTWERGVEEHSPSQLDPPNTLTLTIDPLTLNDLGNYTCWADNDLGRDNETVELEGVLPTPTILSGGGGVTSHTLSWHLPPPLTLTFPPHTYRLRLREVPEEEEEEEEDQEEEEEEEETKVEEENNEEEEEEEDNMNGEEEEEEAEEEDQTGDIKEEEEEAEEEEDQTGDIEEEETGNEGNTTTMENEKETNRVWVENENQEEEEEQEEDEWTVLVFPVAEALEEDGDMSYTLTNLHSNTRYQVTVALQNTFGWSPESEMLEFVTEKEVTTTMPAPEGQMVVSHGANRSYFIQSRVLEVVMVVVLGLLIS